MNKAQFNKLLKKAKIDETAFETLFNFYYKRIVNHLTVKFGRTVAEDAAQEFFARLIQKEHDEKVNSPTAWVFACAENIAKRMISKELPFVELDEKERLKNNETEWTINEELFGDLYDVIKTLSVDEQKIIYLIYWEGYNLKEVALIMKISHNAARQRHSRAIKKIKAKNVTL